MVEDKTKTSSASAHASPLPEVGVSKVIGFLEVLHDNKGAADTVQLATDLNVELDALLPVLEASELLGFIEVKSGKVCLTNAGSELIEKTLVARRELLRKQLTRVAAFKKVVQALESRPGKRMKLKSLVKQFKASAAGAAGTPTMSEEQASKTVARVLDWGRHAEVLGFDSDKKEVYLL